MQTTDSQRKITYEPEGFMFLDSVDPQPLEWLWPNRIVKGKITIVAGNGGIGKSFLAIDMAARLSRGIPWPDSPEEPGITGSTVIITAEDDMDDTVAPRLDAAGADRSKVCTFKGVRIKEGNREIIRAFDLKNGLDVLDAVKQKAPDLALVVLDPITGYMGDIDSHANADVRRVLDKVAQWAALNHVAVLAITHLNKNTGTDVGYRIIGSVGFTAVARMTCFVEQDKDNPERKLFIPHKNNLSKNEGALAYKLEDVVIKNKAGVEINTAKCVWEDGTVAVTAEEAMQSVEESLTTTQKKAIDWLKDLLKEGPMMTSDVFEAGKEVGYSESTLKRIKKHLQIKTRKSGVGSGWEWEL